MSELLSSPFGPVVTKRLWPVFSAADSQSFKCQKGKWFINLSEDKVPSGVIFCCLQAKGWKIRQTP